MSTMSKVYLVRHGESTFNLQKRFTGSTDAPLTEKGHTQAVQAGKKLQSTSIQHIFSSEKIRAHQTAIGLAQQLPNVIGVIPDARLNEQNFGELEGMLKKEADAQFGAQTIYQWRKHPETCPPGGEPLQNVIDRTELFYHEKLAPILSKGESIVVVAHSNSLRALAKHLLSLNVSEFLTFALENARPYVIAFQDKQVLNHQYL